MKLTKSVISTVVIALALATLGGCVAIGAATGAVGGAVLTVSQFTLYGDARGQNRPSYIHAARPELARPLYEYCVQQFRALGLQCETGRFQEIMQVELVNDGPVTILLDSEKQF